MGETVETVETARKQAKRKRSVRLSAVAWSIVEREAARLGLSATSALEVLVRRTNQQESMR